MKYLKKISYIFIGLFFVNLLNSCDYAHVWDYYVINESNEVIKIEHKEFEKAVIIYPNDTSLVHTIDFVYGSVGVWDLREDREILNWEIIVDENIIELDNSLWQYEKKEKYYAEYLLLVDSALLNL